MSKGKKLLSNAFKKGKKSFRFGEMTNPYRKDTILFKEWERGFNTGYFERLDRCVA